MNHDNIEIGRLLVQDKEYKIEHGKQYKPCYSLSCPSTKPIYIQTKKNHGPDVYIKYDSTRRIILETLDSDERTIFYSLYTFRWCSDSLWKKRFQQTIDWMTNPMDIAEQTRTDFYETVYTIDPSGSVDLDDGFSVTENGVYIHIADPASYFNFSENANHPILKELLTRLSTCYIHKTRHLFPNEFMEKVSFLMRDGDLPKRSLSLCLRWNETEEGPISYTIHSFRLHHIHNYSYEQFENKVSSPPLIERMKKIMHRIQTELSFPISSQGFVHDWIQVLMISFNYYLCKHFISQSTSFIGRVQQKTEEGDSSMFASSVPSYVIPFLYQKANYELIVPGSTPIKTMEHAQLQMEHYAHCSSPMRRTIDFLNHCIYYQDQHVMTNVLPKMDWLKLNEQISRYQLYASTYDICQVLDENCVFKAFLLEIDDYTITLILKNSHFQKRIKTLKPLNRNDLMINTEMEVELYYEASLYRGIIPFRIVIL